MKFKKLVRLFLEFTEQHRKTATLKHYQGRLRVPRKLLKKKKIKRLSLEQIEQALNAANRSKDGTLLAPDTRRANAVVLQHLFRFAVRRGYLKEMPFDKLERPRGRRRERIPTAAENQAVEEIADSAFLLVFRALRQSAARPGELAAAEIEHWHRDERLLVIPDHKTIGSTGRPREIGVGRKLEALLKESIGKRTEGPIFLDARGRPWTTEKLSATYRKLRKQAGLRDDLCLYLQRHLHATVLTEKVGIEAAKESLGHASITTTMRYDHPEKARLAINQDEV